MRKILTIKRIIKRCPDCVHYINIPNDVDCCKLMECSYAFIPLVDDVPEWCKLDDYEKDINKCDKK